MTSKQSSRSRKEQRPLLRPAPSTTRCALKTPDGGKNQWPFRDPGGYIHWKPVT
jgi:hypothetical protein